MNRRTSYLRPPTPVSLSWFQSRQDNRQHALYAICTAILIAFCASKPEEALTDNGHPMLFHRWVLFLVTLACLIVDSRFRAQAPQNEPETKLQLDLAHPLDLNAQPH